MLAFHRILLPMTLALLIIGAMSAVYAVDYLAVGCLGGAGAVAVYDQSSGELVNNTSMVGIAADGLEFAPDGYLYISSYQDPAGTRSWDVLRCPTGTWMPQEEFALLMEGGLIHSAVSAVYAPDGFLYIMNVYGRIYRTNTPGEPSILVAGLGGDNRGMTLGPDGVLYTASQGQLKIHRYSIAEHAILPAWPVRQINNQATYPNGVSFGPDANSDGKSDLYVTYWAQTVIDIYDGQNGSYIGIFDDILNYVSYSNIWTQVWNCIFASDGSTAYFSIPGEGKVFKKVGSAPATEFITGLNSPRPLALTNQYRMTWTAQTISDAKILDDESPVACLRKTVTAVGPDYLYVEEPNRSSGIRVAYNPEQGLAVGNVLNVIGTMATAETGERYINPATIGMLAAAGTGIQPLLINNKALGGGDAGTPPSGQRGVANGSGLNNIGLLVKTTGRVSQPNFIDSFMLSDGSGVSVRVILQSGMIFPQDNAYVSVTGISSCENDGASLQRVILATE